MIRKMMRKAYIAAPFRGRTAWEVENNIRIAEYVGFQTAKELGDIPVIPHTMYHYFDGTITDEFWLNATTELLKICDYVIFCDGWKSSRGCLKEHETANELDIPCFFRAPICEYV